MQQNQRQINTIGIAYMVSSKYQSWIIGLQQSQDFMKKMIPGEGRIERNHEGLGKLFQIE